jgi:hypothetical protein
MYVGASLAGSRSSSIAWGDAGCPSAYSDYIYCYAGYRRDGNTCMAEPPGPPPPPLPSCSFGQVLVNGVCQDLTFTRITGNLCGTYVAPIEITPGVHLVTCDVSFLSKVRIAAGAELRFDDEWSWYAAAGTHALGTSASPVSFTVSVNSPAAQWKMLSFTSATPLSLRRDYTVASADAAANYFAYTSFSNRAGATSTSSRLRFTKTYLDHATFGSLSSAAALEDGISWDARIDPGATLSLTRSLAARSSGSGGLTAYESSVVLWSTGALAITMNSYSGPALAAFNASQTLTCPLVASFPESSYVYANATVTGTACSSAGTQHVFGNVTGTTVPTTKVLFNTGSQRITGVAGRPVALPRMLVVTPTALEVAPSPPAIRWTATWMLDGVTHSYATPWDTSDDPVVTIDGAETYKLCPALVDGSSTFLGAEACLTFVVDQQ